MFYTTGAFGKSNFRYEPLLSGSGNLAVVNLSGVNTVRLTVAVPRATQYQQGLSLNYLAFVPAVPQVYSCSQAKGAYAAEVNMLVDTGHKLITVPQHAGNTWFYRIGWHTAVKITGISLQGGNIVMTYQ
jgi:hypothetical protein